MALFQTPDLDDRERRVLAQIDKLRERLRYLIGESPRRWQGLLRRNTFARAIQGSNSIEGYHVSVEDAVAAVDGEEPADTTTETWHAVRGYRAAMTYVMQMADDPYFRFSPGIIKSLHFMMMEHDLTRNPGKWRPGSGV
jgi:Fic family protein